MVSDGFDQTTCPEGRSHSPETLRSFLDHARALADWHRQRSENFESKAGVLIGFTGVILALTSLIAAPISKVGGWWRVVLTALLVASVVAYLLSAFFAVNTLRPRLYRFASSAQLRREWVKYRDAAAQEDTQIIGMFADSLICGGDGESPIESLASDALDRGKQVGRSIRSLFVGLVVEAAVAAILGIEAMTR